MLAAFGLLFIALPFLAAWSLEFEGFVMFFLIFCVAAGVCSPSTGSAAAETTRGKQVHQAPKRDDAARSSEPDRLPDFSRL